MTSLSQLSVQKGKANKFRNVPTTVDGVLFASKKEARRWGELKLMQKVGLISDLRRQVVFALEVNGIHICKYVADFVFAERGKTVVEDSKGFVTPEFRLKSKLMLALHGVEVKLT